MKHELKHKMCLLCGDIHGCLRDEYYRDGFLDSVDKVGGINDSDIIILGDIGIGFKRCYEVMVELDKWAAENDCDVWVFRGNHDNPSMFKKEFHLWGGYTNIHLLEDGDVVTSRNGKKYLVVPGSISIDRSVRELGETYWNGEYLNMELYEKMEEEQFDGIFAHTGPTPPQCLKSTFVDNWADREKFKLEAYGYCNNFDKPLYELIKVERENVDKIIDKFKPKYWFNGHYHQDAQFEHKGVRVFALSICKFLELDKYE